MNRKEVFLRIRDKYPQLRISDAQDLDYNKYGFSGQFWCSGFDFPNENKYIFQDNCLYKAQNVGDCTFNLIFIKEIYAATR